MIRNGSEGPDRDGADGDARAGPDYERLQNLIRNDILSGRIAGGARLKVGDLAVAYGTSTNPAREALRGLEGEGLVVILPNRGARVRVIDETFVSNIFDIRMMIEPHIVRHFVETAAPADVEALETLQQGCERGAEAGDHATFHAFNTRFHDVVLDHHFNTEAVAIMRRHSVWLRALNRKHPLTVPQMRRSNEEHVAFVEAVHKGDADQAVAVMQRHRQNSRRIFLAHTRGDAGPGPAPRPRPSVVIRT